MFAIRQKTWSLTATAGAASHTPLTVIHIALGDLANGAEANRRSDRRQDRGSVVEGRALSLGLASADQNEVVVVSKTAEPPSQAELARFAAALTEGVRRAQLLSPGVDWFAPSHAPVDSTNRRP